MQILSKIPIALLSAMSEFTLNVLENENIDTVKTYL